MVKRLLITIGVVLALIFVPYLLHPVSKKIINMPIISGGIYAEWFDGFVFCFFIAAGLFIMVIIWGLFGNIYNWIKDGN